MHAGGVQEGLAVAALEKWSVAERGWEWSDRLYVWMRNRRAGMKTAPRMSDAAQGEPTAQAGVRKEGAKRGLKWQVSARLIFHPSHGPFVVQSKQKCLDWIWLQEHRWMRSHADTCAQLCIPDKNIHPIKCWWHVSLLLESIHTGQTSYFLTEACKLRIWAFF